MTSGSTRQKWHGWALAATLFTGALAWAGGTPEDALLLIDPTRPDAMYVGNYYLNARDIPPVNVLYMDPMAADYWTFVDDNLDGLFGTLANTGTRDQIDYIVMPPASGYRIYAEGLVSDACYPVEYFSLSGVYTLWAAADNILSGVVPSSRANRYFGLDNDPLAFDSTIRWKNGVPMTDGTGQRYLIGAYLGYTGLRGNTVDEIIDMIDRSVAVDGTRPAGTFYYMETIDPRSVPRDFYFPTAVADITALGGDAQHLFAVLPTGQHDCLGIMTGLASPDIDGTDMTILPGALCDHLTSWAGHFDISLQVKMSRWIANGASGTWGTVEEPCSYGGKFPHPRAYVYYYQGLSLGESLFRSAGFMPFQGLLYGDPLTRLLAYLPDVQVPDAPTGVVSGTLVLTPNATTPHPTAQIESFDLLIDGVLYGSIAPGEQFSVDTNVLSDGWHDLRVLAYDDLDQRFTGRWVGSMTTNNHGRSATLAVLPGSGNWTTAFDVTLDAAGTNLIEVRLLHNGRVVAASQSVPAQVTVHGLTLGAGPVRLQAEARFPDREKARSEPVDLQIAYSGDTPSGQAPVAFSYRKRVLPDEPFVVELPATFDDPNDALTYELLSAPVHATAVSGTGPYRLMRPEATAYGLDPFTFQVHSAAGSSNIATVTLEYWECLGDLNGDRKIDLSDLAQLLVGYGLTTGAEYEDGDLDGDGDVDLYDLADLLAHYGDVCF